jgi:hypothetical protein
MRQRPHMAILGCEELLYYDLKAVLGLKPGRPNKTKAGSDQPEVRGHARCKLPYPLRQRKTDS